jgi:hypothetical protein
MKIYTETEIKQFLLEMAKRCREDMELPLNLYLENVSKNIDEITYVHPLEDDIPPTSKYFPIEYSRKEVLNILDKFLESMLKGEKTGLIEKWFDETYGSKGSDATSSQTEISDEEIQKAAKEYDIKSTRWGAKTIFIDAIKWYREQLKQKQ